MGLSCRVETDGDLQTATGGKQALQHPQHHLPMGSTKRERHAVVYQTGGEVVGDIRIPVADASKSEWRTTCESHSRHDLRGERHTDGASANGRPVGRV